MPLFRYSKKIDESVKPALLKAAGLKVISVSKIDQGEVNHVYKVRTGRGDVIVRVFRHRDWPEDGKLQWIEKQFKKHRIPHAKMLFYDRTSRFFPNGFMVSEYIEGKPASDAVRARELSRSKFYFEDAKLLKRVHQIRCKKFGLWKNGALGNETDFVASQVSRLRKKIDRFKKTPFYEKDLSKKISDKIIELLGPVKSRLRPVLTHGDPSEDNCIWSKKKGLILVDWDNAMASIGFRDYANLMHWESYSVQFNNEPKSRATNASKAFLRGYGKSEFSAQEIERIRSALFIIEAVDLLPYYYFDQKNRPVFLKMRARLQSLLA